MRSMCLSSVLSGPNRIGVGPQHDIALLHAQVGAIHRLTGGRLLCAWVQCVFEMMLHVCVGNPMIESSAAGYSLKESMHRHI